MSTTLESVLKTSKRLQLSIDSSMKTPQFVVITNSGDRWQCADERRDVAGNSCRGEEKFKLEEEF